MDKKYKFSYEPISVYACAVDLVRKYTGTGAIHIDLGCGYAAIARQIESGGVRYIGFDANRESVETLKTNGIEAYELDLTEEAAVISQLKSLCEGYSIVTISMLDVIEHLDYDCRLLSRIKESFSSDQQLTLVLSVPNSSHTDVAIKLLAGAYDYLDTGLLDKTHTTVYTEANLREVTQKNGWRQVAANDYHLEFSEQFFERPSLILNRDSGIGKDFRKLKGVLDPNADVYQFVRAYVPVGTPDKQQPGKTGALRTSVSLVFPETIDAAQVSALIARCTTLESNDQIQLVLPEHLEGVAEGSSIVIRYHKAMIENFVKTSLGTTHWSYVNVPEEVCASALDALIDQLDCTRGTPVVELAQGVNSAHTLNQFELFSSIATDSSWRVLIPAGYAREFDDRHFAGSTEEWQGFVRRAALACGITRVHVPFNTAQSPLAAPIEPLAALSIILSDQVLQSYIVRSEIWADVISDKLQRMSAQNISLETLNSKLETRNSNLDVEVETLRLQLNDILTSKSWRLTRYLRGVRRTASKSIDIARAMFRGNKTVLRSCARAVYLRVPVLKFVWSFCQYKKMSLMRGIHDKTFSRDNIHSLNALSDKRFSKKIGTHVDLTLSDLPEIDLSAVSYNSSRWVDRFFASLAAQNYPLSKIHFNVVDNGSTDNSVALFEEYLKERGGEFASAKVIRQNNLGFGAGHDRAIKAGSSDFCLIVNLDLEFLEDSIVTAVRTAVADKDSSAASWELRQIPYEHPKYYDPVTLETNWSSHACVLLKREAYERCGGYDHAIFMYGEDVELSYRLRSFGYSLKYLPGAPVLHYTYEEAGEVKPLQFAGSVLGNTYIRLRYGSFGDRFMALALYAALFVYPSQFPGSKKMLLRNVPKLLKNVPHFLKGKGPVPAKFPFRGYDYELIRDGAFFQAEPIANVDSLPLVTVITRTYRGRGMFLKQAMESVFNQTYPKIELLVAEDGGETQAALVESLAKFAPANVRVRFLANEKIGRSGVGNAAMAIASGDYYMFLDDDDLLFADHVETLMQCLNKDASIDAAYSLAFEVTTHVNEDKTSYVEEMFYTPPVFRQAWDYEVMKRHNFIPIQSIIFKKELYSKWGGFDLGLDQLEDWSLWLCYGYDGNFRYIEKTTSLFRTPADSNVRAHRHALLHDAYNVAVQSAKERIDKVTGHSG
jgi:GT2 family glycosyltransferase/2-polyprenyl-3-methyl-5-hydroxy-6-metoxy-1,4-benzoquinol methylase